MEGKAGNVNVSGKPEEASKWLFWTCFIALVATSFGFIIRANIIGELGVHFNLSETQKGEILGVGLWPFALSIIGGSAAALAYEVSRYTNDIDTVDDVSKIQTAYEAAKSETGLEIPFGPARVADFPYEYESRLEDVPLS